MDPKIALLHQDLEIANLLQAPKKPWKTYKPLLQNAYLLGAGLFFITLVGLLLTLPRPYSQHKANWIWLIILPLVVACIPVGLSLL